MIFESTLAFAKKWDSTDPLRRFRKHFFFPSIGKKESVYLCGHSLGLLSDKVTPAIHGELADWKKYAIKGYRQAKNPWLVYQHGFQKSLAEIVGCKPAEVTVMNTLTVNLHLLMLSFYRPTPSRCKIIMEAGAFPSDQYMVETQVRFHGLEPKDAMIEIFPKPGQKTLSTSDVLETIERYKDEVAIVLFSGINYYTGQLFDIKAITEAAHEAGAIAGFDLAHVAGNVPVLLHDWNVDFAAWCSYKYLNGGPGAAGGLFVHEKFTPDPALPRLGGWWGNDEATRFEMKKGFVPQAGAAGWNMSTAQVFNMVSLKASLKYFDKAGIQNLRAKSLALTGYLEYLLKRLTHLDLEIITPAEPAARGSQLSIYFKKDCGKIFDSMLQQGIVVDYRAPDVIRVAPAPLYNSFKDIYKLYEVLKNYTKQDPIKPSRP